MAWTKQQFIEAAFEEIGLASYTFDLQPQQLESALRRLDTMIASWNALGIRIGYPIPVNPNQSSLSQSTEVPDSANDAIILNLAIRLAPSYGRAVMAETKMNAKQTYDTLLSRAAIPPEMQFPDTLPVGAGNKPWNIDQPFVIPPRDVVDAGPDGILNYN
jgi:hypothetical protein